MVSLSKQASDKFASALGLAGAADADLGDSEFAGTWSVKDTDGNAFEITLTASGVAEADRDGEGMNGTWDADGLSAVIAWDTGWTTKITRTGDTYTKTAYDPTAAAPTNTSSAEKVA